VTACQQGWARRAGLRASGASAQPGAGAGVQVGAALEHASTHAGKVVPPPTLVNHVGEEAHGGAHIAARRRRSNQRVVCKAFFKFWWRGDKCRRSGFCACCRPALLPPGNEQGCSGSVQRQSGKAAKRRRRGSQVTTSGAGPRARMPS
jgi:hypothetical protein